MGKKGSTDTDHSQQIGLDLLCERLIIGGLVASEVVDSLDSGIGNDAIELGIV
jgi:hypothetical protein